MLVTRAMTAIVPVILCGGSGTRLWPKSRAALPKPFLPLIGGSTLFEATVARCAPFGAPLVVTGAAHLGHVEAQLDNLAGATVIVEVFAGRSYCSSRSSWCCLSGSEIACCSRP